MKLEAKSRLQAADQNVLVHVKYVFQAIHQTEAQLNAIRALVESDPAKLTILAKLNLEVSKLRERFDAEIPALYAEDEELQAKVKLLALQDLKTLGPRLLEVLKDTFETADFELTHNGKAEIKSNGRLSDGMFKIGARDLNKLVFSHLGYKIRDEGSTIYWSKHGEPTWCMSHTGGKVHLYEQ